MRGKGGAQGLWHAEDAIRGEGGSVRRGAW
jgi:hypothetical protein